MTGVERERRKVRLAVARVERQRNPGTAFAMLIDRSRISPKRVEDARKRA